MDRPERMEKTATSQDITLPLLQAELYDPYIDCVRWSRHIFMYGSIALEDEQLPSDRRQTEACVQSVYVSSVREHPQR